MSSSSDKKGKRREAREHAVQFLFQHEMNPPENLTEQVAAKTALQNAAAQLAERVLPRLVK